MLSILWFILIAVLWIGYLVLEGFDLGVAMLLPFVSKNDKERTTALKTIGPHWDGNEVWLVAPCSPHSPSGTPQCSPACTSHCSLCWSC